MQRYPRDMRGHGATPPDAQWPGGARIAVQIVVNFEEGGERNLLHGDGESEAFLSEIVGAEAWPGMRHWNMETIYEYGARAGFWRLHRLLADTPVTVFGVATALARAPEPVRAMQEAGWEIASHGLKWIEYAGMPVAEERAQMAEAIRLHTEVTGDRPRGWYTGRCSMNTLALVAEEGGFAYAADSYADDLPYWHRAAGRDQLVVPYTLDANDMRFAVSAGFGGPGEFADYLKAAFDRLYAEGTEGAPRMLSIGLHCRLSGRPARAEALREALAHMRAHAGVWFATRAEIADHWAATHPPAPGPRPSEMSYAEFVAAFGDVFEGSPWVAQRAHALELGPAHDGPVGVHSALCRAFRSAAPAERLATLRAHPSLAHRLAAATPLSPDSAAEQASVGLDALTPADRAEFDALNAAYEAKFAHPFIIAVRDHDTAGILATFRDRLARDPAAEMAEACRQVERIAELRLADRLS